MTYWEAIAEEAAKEHAILTARTEFFLQKMTEIVLEWHWNSYQEHGQGD